MALKVVNTESLDAVANAINAKAGTSGTIQFPDGFVEAIEAIQAGGGEDLSTVLAEQEELVAELKSIIAQKAKLGDAKLPSIIERTVTEITAEDLAGITRIGDGAFRMCQKLTRVQLSDTVRSIDPYAFTTCIKCGSLDLAKLERLEQYGCERLGSDVTTDFPLTIPSTVRGIGIYGLTRSGITSVTVEDRDEPRTIGANAFYYCARLKRADIFGSDFEHGSYTGSQFNGCTALEEVTLDENVTKLSSNIFYGCTALKHLIVPKSVTIIGNNAFYNCKAMEYIDFTAYGTDIDFPSLSNADVFKNCGASTASGTFEIRVSSGRKAELAAMTNWSTYADNIVEV